MARPILPGLLVIGGGILFLLAGLVLVGLGGYTGDIGVATGVATIVVGLLIPALPRRRGLLAFVALAFGVVSIYSALAGFVVGIFLVVLGSTLAFIWVPPSPAGPSPRSPPSVRAR